MPANAVARCLFLLSNTSYVYQLQFHSLCSARARRRPSFELHTGLHAHSRFVGASIRALCKLSEVCLQTEGEGWRETTGVRSLESHTASEERKASLIFSACMSNNICHSQTWWPEKTTSFKWAAEMFTTTSQSQNVKGRLILLQMLEVSQNET